MAQFHAGTPSAWARLSKHGGLDINSIPRDEAEDLINKIAALEDQLNESEINYERLYAEYEKAKTYYQDIEASIEAATETYLAEKGQFLAQQETDAATITELRSQLEEERKAKELAQSQLSAAKGQLAQVQEEAAAAKQALQKLTKEHEAALKDYISTQSALEKAEATAVAAQEVARAAEEAASQRIALADQMEWAADEATKAVKKREAALQKEETNMHRALEEKEKNLAKREAELDSLLATNAKQNQKAALPPRPSSLPIADGADGAGPSSTSPERKASVALRAPTATKPAAIKPAAAARKRKDTSGGIGVDGVSGSGKQASKKSISAALFLEPISGNKVTVSDQQPTRRLAVKVARKAGNGIEEEEEDEDEAPAGIATAAAVAGPSGRSRGRAATAPSNAAKKAAAAAAPSVKKTTATKRKVVPKKTTSTSTSTKKATALEKSGPSTSAAHATVAKRGRGRPRKEPATNEGTTAAKPNAAAATKSTGKNRTAVAVTGPSALPAVNETETYIDDAEVQPAKRSRSAAAAPTTSTTSTMVTAVENFTVTTRSGRVSKAATRENSVATSTGKAPASKKSTRSKGKVLAV